MNKKHHSFQKKKYVYNYTCTSTAVQVHSTGVDVQQYLWKLTAFRTYNLYTKFSMDIEYCIMILNLVCIDPTATWYLKFNILTWCHEARESTAKFSLTMFIRTRDENDPQAGFYHNWLFSTTVSQKLTKPYG